MRWRTGLSSIMCTETLRKRPRIVAQPHAASAGRVSWKAMRMPGEVDCDRAVGSLPLRRSGRFAMDHQQLDRVAAAPVVGHQAVGDADPRRGRFGQGATELDCIERARTVA